MRCPECDHENPEGAKFCMKCGATLLVPCPQCGVGNLPGARFCSECGHSLLPRRPEGPKEPKGRGLKALVTVVGVVVVCVALGAGVWYLWGRLDRRPTPEPAPSATQPSTGDVSLPPDTPRVSSDTLSMPPETPQPPTAKGGPTNTPSGAGGYSSAWAGEGRQDVGLTQGNASRVAQLRDDGTLVLTDINGNTLTEMQTGVLADSITWEMSWSPNGEYLLVLASSGDQDYTYLVDTKKKETHQWPEPILTEFQYQWSPDSTRIAVHSGYESGWQLDIFSLYGTERRTIYQGWGGVNNFPTWSPNSQNLAVAGSPSRSRPFRFYFINANTGETKDITPAAFERAGFSNDWLRDGRLVFAGFRQGVSTLQILNPTTGNVVPLLKNPPENRVGWPCLSPSGNLVAYAVEEPNGHWSLHIEDLLTNQRQQIWRVDAAVGVYPESWSPAEHYLVFTLQTDSGAQNNQLFLIDIISRQEQPLPGRRAWNLQSSDIYSSSKGWIDDERLVVAQSLDQGTKFVLVDVNGNELQELCAIKLYDMRCTLWTP